MAKNNKNKKNKRKSDPASDYAQSGQLNDAQQGSSQPPGDPSRSRIGDDGDPPSDYQEAVHGDQAQVPLSSHVTATSSHELGSPFASTLSALSNTRSGRDAAVSLQESSNKIGHDAPIAEAAAQAQYKSTNAATTSGKGKSAAKVASKDQRATVEEVSDDEDVRPHESAPQSRPGCASIEFVHAVIPPSPPAQRTEKSAPKSVSNGSARSSVLTSSSPYPVSTGSPVLVNLESALARSRGQMSKGKERRDRADSIESAELREAAARSLADIPAESDAGSQPRRSNWDDHNVRLAAAALARERGENESPTEYRRRIAAWKRNDNHLRTLREADDREMAEDLLVQELQEQADRELAEEIQQQEEQEARAARKRDAATRRLLEHEEAEISAMEKHAAEKRADTDRRRNILNQYVEEKRSSARARSIARSSGSDSQSTVKSVRPFLAPRPSEDGRNNPTPRERVVHTLADRIILQRMRYLAIANGEDTTIPDQNIDWDEKGVPYAKGSAPSRGSSVGYGRKSSGSVKPGGDKSPKSPNASMGIPTAESTRRMDKSTSNLRKSQSTDHRNESVGQRPANNLANQIPVKSEPASGFYSRRGSAPPKP
ncbi:hypothetical protein B0H17DRAFT_1144109, partial [Mycena rosella]